MVHSAVTFSEDFSISDSHESPTPEGCSVPFSCVTPWPKRAQTGEKWEGQPHGSLACVQRSLLGEVGLALGLARL